MNKSALYYTLKSSSFFIIASIVMCLIINERVNPSLILMWISYFMICYLMMHLKQHQKNQSK